MTAELAPGVRIGDPCPVCGRRVRADPKTPGCYLGRCYVPTPPAERISVSCVAELDELLLDLGGVR